MIANGFWLSFRPSHFLMLIQTDNKDLHQASHTLRHAKAFPHMGADHGV
jgi:hypothetical protein